jgi:tetratricopeptide (TPR) repeat protein
VIIPKLLFNSATHIRLFLHCFFLSAVILSCKSLKPDAKANPLNSSTDVPGENSGVKFDFHFVNGCSERMKGNLKEAKVHFSVCKELQPQNPAVRYELAMIHRLLGLNDMALDEAKICALAEPQNEWYHLLLIECYRTLHKNNEMIKAQEELVKQFPERNDFKQDLAYSYAITGQFNKSLQVYTQLEKQVGVNEELCMNKVKLYKELNKPDDAEKELLKLVHSKPEESLYRTYLADFYMEYKQPEKAKPVYDTLLIMDPDNPAVQLALHDYFSLKGEQQKAFEQLKMAFSNAELDAASKAQILISYMSQSENTPAFFAQGKELAEILLKVHPNSPEANALYAEFLIRENNLNAASVYLSKAAYLNSANYDTWDKLLLADIELSRLDSLELHSSKALELFPNQAMVYYYNGYANLQLKNYTKALHALNDGAALVNGNASLLLRFLSSAGDAAYYAGQTETAFKKYEEALKIDPDNTYVLNNYAYFLSLKNTQLEKAEKLSKRSLELKPEEKNYMDTYGWILYMQKKYTEAEVWLSKAAAMMPPNANILEHYGDVLFQNKKINQAIETWEAALELNKSNASLKEKIKCKCLNENQNEK